MALCRAARTWWNGVAARPERYGVAQRPPLRTGEPEVAHRVDRDVVVGAAERVHGRSPSCSRPRRVGGARCDPDGKPRSHGEGAARSRWGCQHEESAGQLVAVALAAAPVLPVAPDRGLRARQPLLLEQVAADALDGRRLPRHPHRGARRRRRCRRRRRRARRPAPTPSAAGRTSRRSCPERSGRSSRASGWATSMCTWTGGPVGNGLEQLADGGDRRLVAGQDEAGRLRVDGVAPARAGESHRVAGLGRLGPRRRRATVVEDDVDVEAVVAEAAGREGSDRRTAAVGQEELVAVPRRDHELADPATAAAAARWPPAGRRRTLRAPGRRASPAPSRGRAG